MPSQALFRLVAVFKARDSGLETLMDINGAPKISKKQLQALEVQPGLVLSPKSAAPICCDESPSCSKPASVPAPKLAKRRVDFSLDLPKMTGKRPLIAEEGSSSPESAEENLEITEIDSMCSCLSQMAPQNPSSRMSSSPCLGYLSGTDDYRYLVYKTNQWNPNMGDRSLRDLTAPSVFIALDHKAVVESRPGPVPRR
jgi:hypothetical protein